MQYLGATSEKAEWSQFISKANHSASQKSKSMPQPPMVKKLKWSVLWSDDYDLKVLWPKRPAKTNIKNRCPLHHRGLECKSRKSRGTWSNRQVWPWSTKWSRAKANWILPREFTGHSKHLSLNNTRDDFIHGHHQMVKLKSDYIPCSCRWRSCIQSAKTRPGADCGSDHQLLIAKFRLKLKKTGKTTSPAR